MKNINESYTRIKNNNIDDIIDRYSSVIEKYVNDGVKIYRGMEFSGEYLIGDTTGMYRKASDISNYVNMLTGYLPSWNEWPARTESFICSTNRDSAKKYGSVYIVIPLTYNKIGVCKEPDFWDSLPVNIEYDHNEKEYDIPALCFAITDFLFLGQFLGVSAPSKIDTDPTLFFNTISKIIKTANEKYPNIQDIRPLLVKNKISSSNYNFIINLLQLTDVKRYFNMILNPSSTNELIDDSSSLLKYKGNKHEVWMSGKALFIDIDTWHKFRENILKRKS
jgi:hypothetical protein